MPIALLHTAIILHTLMAIVLGVAIPIVIVAVVGVDIRLVRLDDLLRLKEVLYGGRLFLQFKLNHR